MVKRDRNHPSVMAWSLCNEVGCNNESSAQPFTALTRALDPTRPITQNNLGTNASTKYLDVQGFSHSAGETFDAFHLLHPDKPTMATECCACWSQRGEDADLTPSDPSVANRTRFGLFYNNLIAPCEAEQILRSDGREFVAGTVREGRWGIVKGKTMCDDSNSCHVFPYTVYLG